MARKKYPLELVLNSSGIVELLDADENTIWSSDDDDDFKDEFDNEFIEESDMEDVLDYLESNDIVSAAECDKFESGDFDVIVESMDAEEYEDIDEENKEHHDIDSVS